jgi:hypothetical protein
VKANSPVILAFLQNAWFKNPAEVKKIFERHPEQRNSLIKKFLFYRSLTGRRLKTAFGEELCEQIIWEESSLEIADNPKAIFPADPAHMRSAIEKHRPAIMIAFGQIAKDGLRPIWKDESVWSFLNGGRFTIEAPHPAARGEFIIGQLRWAAEGLKEAVRITKRENTAWHQCPGGNFEIKFCNYHPGGLRPTYRLVEMRRRIDCGYESVQAFLDYGTICDLQRWRNWIKGCAKLEFTGGEAELAEIRKLEGKEVCDE